ncbi:MAG: 3-deoxy-7-phosphoheptulonate synthase [Caldisphaeraceae archaeon]|nr:3-deoxy-7-phosphoheptulonate synthase [Caldisphaeraceae archaeon]
MIFILKDGSSFSSLKEKIGLSSSSYRLVDIYGKRVVVAWPDENLKGIKDEAVEVKVIPHAKYQLSSKAFKEKTIVKVDQVDIGGEGIVVAAGPCSVEGEDQAIEIAKAVKRSGASLFRGGVFKPRTSPYSFQGMGYEGLKILRKVKEETGLSVVSELMDVREISSFDKHIDMLQVGARNSQNYPLLKELGKIKKPVLLKRGFGNTVEEWILSSEYILLEGNGDVVLCERGIRTFERSTRFTLDVGGIVVAKTLTHLPLCADPSHPAGKKDYVESLALASIAAGADMLLIEVHNNPEKALSDADQQLTIMEFEKLMKKLKSLAIALGRRL